LSQIKISLSPKQAVELIAATTIADIYDADLLDTTKEIRAQIRSESTRDERFNKEFSQEVSNFKKQ